MRMTVTFIVPFMPGATAGLSSSAFPDINLAAAS
jgi:hypothetical protein